MTELLVLGLIASVLTGTAGDTVDASVVLYTDTPTTVQIEEKVVALPANKTMQVIVPLIVERGVQQQHIHVSSATVQYTVPVTVIGRRDWSWLWWLLTIPLCIFLGAFSFRRAAGSS